MDPIELLELCRKGAHEGAPADIVVPRLFSAGEYEDLWRRERPCVRRLLDDLLCGPHADDGLDLLAKSGAVGALFPELRAIQDLGDDPRSSLHKDVWRHTTQVVVGVPPTVELRWAALLHDVGKSRTRRFVDGRVTFHNHDVVGARMVGDLDRRLGLFADDVALAGTVTTLVLNHLRPASYDRSWTDSGVRRLVADLGGDVGFERLMALSRADLTTKVPARRNRAARKADELVDRVKIVMTTDARPRLPKGTMGVVLTKVAARPGAWCNAVRDELEAMMQAGVLDADRDVGYYVVAAMALVERHAGA